VSARIAGTVEAVLVDDNQHVKRGQVLVRLDPRDYQVRLAHAKAALDVARRRPARARQSNSLVKVLRQRRRRRMAVFVPPKQKSLLQKRRWLKHRPAYPARRQRLQRPRRTGVVPNSIISATRIWRRKIRSRANSSITHVRHLTPRLQERMLPPKPFARRRLVWCRLVNPSAGHKHSSSKHKGKRSLHAPPVPKPLFTDGNMKPRLPPSRRPNPLWKMQNCSFPTPRSAARCRAVWAERAWKQDSGFSPASRCLPLSKTISGSSQITKKHSSPT